jgi:photoactive yellow protein
MTGIDFGDPNLASRLDEMRQGELDALPFGVLKLDSEGRVVGYNQIEGEIAEVDFARQINHNFFTEIAPCMDNPFFRGRFEDGIKAGGLALDFEFETDMDPRAEHIRVRMLTASTPNQYWVVIKRL